MPTQSPGLSSVVSGIREAFYFSPGWTVCFLLSIRVILVLKSSGCLHSRATPVRIMMFFHDLESAPVMRFLLFERSCSRPASGASVL